MTENRPRSNLRSRFFWLLENELRSSPFLPRVPREKTQPANASNKAVSWSSINENVAMVNITGLVKAVKKGTATITLKTADGGYTAKCQITVQ